MMRHAGCDEQQVAGFERVAAARVHENAAASNHA
jgi:hypothetical protein